MITPSNKPRHFIHTSYGNLALLRGIHTKQDFKPHFHESYTVILVDDGIGDYSAKESNFITSKGTVLIINPYEVHTGKSIDNNPWSFLTLYIPVDLMKKAINKDVQMREGTKVPVFKENIINNKKLFAQGLAVFPALVETINDENSEESLMSFLKSLLACGSFEKVEETQLSDRFVIAKNIRDYIHENCTFHLSLDVLAKKFKTSECNLIKIFKSYYHLPPHQYFINLKIEKAKQLLLQNFSCTDVAYQVGFFDQSHFIRHFKKIVGITPKRFVNFISNKKERERVFTV